MSLLQTINILNTRDETSDRYKHWKKTLLINITSSTVTITISVARFFIIFPLGILIKRSLLKKDKDQQNCAQVASLKWQGGLLSTQILG